MIRVKRMQGCTFLGVFAQVPNFRCFQFERQTDLDSQAGILVAKSVSGSPEHWAAISFCPLRHCQPRAAAFVFPTSPRLYFSDLSICISSNPCPVFAPLNCCDTPFPFSSGLSWQTVFPSQLRLFLVQSQRYLIRSKRSFDTSLPSRYNCFSWLLCFCPPTRSRRTKYRAVSLSQVLEQSLIEGGN